MNIDQMLNAFVTLFATIDSVGMVPILIPPYAGTNFAERCFVALRSAFTAICLLTLFSDVGTAILNAMSMTGRVIITRLMQCITVDLISSVRC